MIDDAASGLELRATALCSLGLLLALDDRPDEARQALRDARRIIDELDLVMPLLINDWPWQAALVERWTGDLRIAEGYLREAVIRQREMRDHWHLAAAAPSLAEMIVLQRDRLDDLRRAEVRELLDEGRRVTLPEDVVSDVAGRSTLARLESAEGRHDEALALCVEACTRIGETEELMFRFDAQNTLHDVALEAGQLDLARQAASVALEVAQAKQSTLFERIARESLART
jgi:tetratricopeptide (TPR) repeat protein